MLALEVDELFEGVDSLGRGLEECFVTLYGFLDFSSLQFV